jgi:hypothetical protein
MTESVARTIIQTDDSTCILFGFAAAFAELSLKSTSKAIGFGTTIQNNNNFNAAYDFKFACN